MEIVFANITKLAIQAGYYVLILKLQSVYEFKSLETFIRSRDYIPLKIYLYAFFFPSNLSNVFAFLQFF